MPANGTCSQSGICVPFVDMMTLIFVVSVRTAIVPDADQQPHGISGRCDSSAALNAALFAIMGSMVSSLTMPGGLDDRGNQRRGDIGRDRLAALGRAFGRQPIEPQLAEPVVQPLVIGELRGVDADELREPLGPGHEPDHVLGRVVRVDHERAARRHAPHVIPALHHRLLDQHDDVRLLVLVGERVFDLADR